MQAQVVQDPQDVVRVTTSLVQVDVVVTKDGKQVTDLKAEDFEILEDGRRQLITPLLSHQTSLQRRTKYAAQSRSSSTISACRFKAWRTCEPTSVNS